MSSINIDPIPLPIKLKPSHLRPVAYRILSKKHGLHIKSSALEVLTDYIGKNFGAEWKSPKALKFLEEVAKTWKAKYQANKNLFIDGDNLTVVIRELNEKKSGKSLLLLPANAAAQNKLDDLVKAKRSDTVADIDIDIDDSSINNHVSGINDNNFSSLQKLNNVSFKLLDIFAIKDCYELPVTKYDHLRKKFEPYMPPQDRLANETNLTKRLAFSFNVQDNLSLYMSRYYQTYHRMLRNESFHFAPPLNPTSSTYFDELELLESTTSALSSSSELNKLKSINRGTKLVTLIKNLLGRHGRQFLIFGLLTKDVEGNYRLQDASDGIELDLSKAYPDENFFYFEGCLLICDGIYVNFGGRSKFVVNLIYHPKAEQKEDFFKNFGLLDFKSEHLDLVNPKLYQDYQNYKQRLINESKVFDSKVYANGEESNNVVLDEEEDPLNYGVKPFDKVIFLGTLIHLDSLKSLDFLKKLFAKLSRNPNNLPVAIVFPGSFVSKSFELSSVNSINDNSSMNYKNLFDSLAIILSEFPSLCYKTHFVFVAGYNDPWSSLVYQGSNSVALPYKRLPTIFLNRLSRVVKNLKLVTNPFKIYYLNSEITVLNDNIYERIIKNDIHFNYYTERKQLIRSLSNSTGDNDDAIMINDNKGNGKKNNDNDANEADDDEDDDEELRTAKQLIASQISKLDNLNINSLAKNSLRHTDAKAFKKDVLKLTNTIINQSHLSPFPQQVKPIEWKYNNLLTMSPLPDALVLLDSTIGYFRESCSGVDVVNVGKFVSEDNRSANYVEYYLASQRTELKKIYYK